MTAEPKNGKHLIARNDALDKKMKQHPDLVQNIEDLFVLGRRNRKLIRVLYGLVVVVVILGAAVTYLTSQVVISKSRAESNHITLVNSCTSGNEFRKDNLSLWTYILNIKPVQPPTDAQKKIANDFAALVNKTFAPRDCTNIK